MAKKSVTIRDVARHAGVSVATASRALNGKDVVNPQTRDRILSVMAELGQDISGHKPMTFEELEDWEGLNFDLIVTLSPEAHHKALELTRTVAADVEYWPTPDPTGTEGSREQKLAAYREVCDALSMRIRRRFSRVPVAGV